MGYNPKNTEVQRSIPSNVMVKGVVVKIDDGIVKDFVAKEYLPLWKNPEQNCIQVTFECLHDNVPYQDKVIFTYTVTEAGKTRYGERTKLGKYAALYKKVPEAGDQIDMKTNKDGFFKVVLE